MGDHIIGRAMGQAALLYWARRGDRPPPSKEEAMSALDKICGPYRNRDAEFESEDPDRPGRIHPAYGRYTDPNGPLGKLIAIAFDATPNEMLPNTDDECPWLEGPERRFDKHYRFW